MSHVKMKERHKKISDFVRIIDTRARIIISDVTGLGRTRQKPDLDYFFQTETRTRLLKRNPKKPEPDYETRPNPKGFCED